MTVEVPMDSKYPDYVAKRKAGGKEYGYEKCKGYKEDIMSIIALGGTYSDSRICSIAFGGVGDYNMGKRKTAHE